MMGLSFSQPDSVLSTTLANYSKTLSDNIFRANPLFHYLVGQHPTVAGQDIQTRGQMKIINGGESIVVPLLYEKNSTAKSYSKYGVIDTTPQEGITSARFLWKQTAATITISGLEERQNAGSDTRVINLLESKAKQAQMSMQEELNRQAFGTGTDSSADLTGLQTICATTGTTGGISRTGNAWWQGKVTASAGSFAAGGVDAMRTMYNNVTRGSDKADLIISDQTTFERYEKTLAPQERFNDTMFADAGFTSLKFKSCPITFDLYCPSGSMYFLNSQYLNLYVHSDANMTTTAFVTPENQDAKTAKILFMGELTVSNASRQGVITGFTA